MIHDQRYYLHIIGYLVIITWKKITDNLNEPIKATTGHWTDIVYAIEGEFVLWVQQAFENDALTAVLNFHYLFIYLFLIYVTTVYFAYAGERDMTDKVTLNYLLIYAIAVPYYLFFNVEVTSSWIEGMKALLYHDATYMTFYVTHDPLDNAVPSLHVAIPFGIILLNWLHAKEKGIRLRDWDHWRYHVFVCANTILFIFAILYLGIHWVVDIPLGMIIGAIGALFIHHVQPRLRNDHGGTFKGFNSGKWRTHGLVEGAICLILLAAIMGVVSSQETRNEEIPSYRLGPGDTTFDIVQELGYEDSVDIEVMNMNQNGEVHVTIVIAHDVIEEMDSGEIDWQSISDVWPVRELAAGEDIDIVVDQPKVWHLIIMHNPGDELVEVKVTNDYHDDKMLTAYALSLPSLWMTAYVLFRLYRLKKEGLDLIDSTPSHKWTSNGNGPQDSEE